MLSYLRHYAKQVHKHGKKTRGLLHDCKNRWIICSSSEDLLRLSLTFYLWRTSICKGGEAPRSENPRFESKLSSDLQDHSGEPKQRFVWCDNNKDDDDDDDDKGELDWPKPPQHTVLSLCSGPPWGNRESCILQLQPYQVQNNKQLTRGQKRKLKFKLLLWASLFWIINHDKVQNIGYTHFSSLERRLLPLGESLPPTQKTRRPTRCSCSANRSYLPSILSTLLILTYYNIKYYKFSSYIYTFQCWGRTKIWQLLHQTNWGDWTMKGRVNTQQYNIVAVTF